MRHGTNIALRVLRPNCLRLAFTVRNRTARMASYLHNMKLICNPVAACLLAGRRNDDPS
jgi:hypothetical protein